jgi:chemotaxis response regulator CheB
MIKVLIFAVDARLRCTLEQLSRNDSGITIVGIADDQQARTRLAEGHHVDVVLTQEMPAANQLEARAVLYSAHA